MSGEKALMPDSVPFLPPSPRERELAITPFKKEAWENKFFFAFTPPPSPIPLPQGPRYVCSSDLPHPPPPLSFFLSVPLSLILCLSLSLRCIVVVFSSVRQPLTLTQARGESARLLSEIPLSVYFFSPPPYSNTHTHKHR